MSEERKAQLMNYLDLTCRETSDHSILEDFSTVQFFCRQIMQGAGLACDLASSRAKFLQNLWRMW
jgi:hypothetical protein